MNSKSKKQLIIIGIFIIVALFIYYHVFNNGSSSRFGFGAVGDAVPVITWKSSPANSLAQPPSGEIEPGTPGSIEAPAAWKTGSTVPNVSLYLKLNGNFTTSPSSILWLFPTTISTGEDTAGTVQVDTIVWPAGI